MVSYSDEDNFYILDNILQTSTQYIRHLFKSRWEEETGQIWVDDLEQVHEFFEGPGNTAFLLASPFQKKILLTNPVAKWNISLLSFVLQNFGDESKYCNENDSVYQISQLRSDIAHHGTNRISKVVFLNGLSIFMCCFTSLGITVDIDKLVSGNKVNASQDANHMLDLASECVKQGNLKKALEFYTDAVHTPNLLPVKLGAVYEERAEFYLSQVNDPVTDSDKITYALEDLEEALKQNDFSWYGFYLAGQCHRWNGNLFKAIEYYERSLAISPAKGRVKEDLNTCRILAGVHVRYDPSNLSLVPRSLTMYSKEIGRRTGKKISEDELTECMESLKFSGTLGENHFHLGNKHFRGWGVPKNYAEAVKHYEKAAVLGNVEGMYSLAMCYQYGYGVSQDVKKAMRMYKAVEVVDTVAVKNEAVASAQFALGHLHKTGSEEISVDLEQAAYWYERSMKNGSGAGATNLGNLYFQGYGVPKDCKMAEVCWKEGVLLKCTFAAATLAGYYLHEWELDKAKKMVGKGRKLKNIALLNLSDKELEMHLEMKERQRDKVEGSVVAYENTENLKTNELTLKQRCFRMCQLTNPKIIKLISVLQTGCVPYAVEHNETRKRLSVKMLMQIIEKAATGSTMANVVLETFTHAGELLERLEKFLGSEPPPPKLERNQIINKLYECITLSTLHIIPLPQNYAQTLQSILESFKTEKREKKGDGGGGGCDRMKMKLCFAVFKLLESAGKIDTHVLHILKKGVRKYPKNTNYLKYMSITLSRMKAFAEGKQYAEKGLKKNPVDLELLFARAMNLKGMVGLQKDKDDDDDEAVQAFKKFISVAPLDHPLVPEAYYNISYLYLHKMKNGVAGDATEDLRDWAHYSYNQGVKLEENLLPCFLPYQESTVKMFAREALREMAVHENRSAPRENTEPTESTAKQDPNADPSPKSTRKPSSSRQKLIVAHRQSLMEPEDIMLPHKNCKSLKQPAPKIFSKMNPITLKDMTPSSTDQIYENRFIDLTIIDDPKFFGGNYISLIVEDINKDAIRLHLRYDNDECKHLIEKYSAGCRLGIINPKVIKVENNGDVVTHELKNEEPRCVVELARLVNMCRFCGRMNASEACKICKRPYCSKQCQNLDWKQLKHQLICLSK